MIPLDAPFTPWVLGAVLVALLSLMGWRAAAKDRREYQRFAAFTSTQLRQATFRKWLLESLGWFGGSTLVVLALAGGFVPRMLAQVDLWPPMMGFRDLFYSSGLVSGVIVGVAIGLLVGIVALVFLGRNVKEVPTIGDIHALLPRNRAELKYGWLLSINAGVVEECLFRLAMPALIFGIFGNALLAIGVSLIVFGLMHAYQGVWGVVGSFVLGVILMAVFLTTGNIIWPIIVHAVIDLRSLVLTPVVVYQVHLPEDRRRVKPGSEPEAGAEPERDVDADAASADNAKPSTVPSE